MHCVGCRQLVSVLVRHLYLILLFLKELFSSKYTCCLNLFKWALNLTPLCLFYHIFWSVPTGAPQNCSNITYNARDIGLQWEEPIRARQNGRITGYNLTCFSMNSWADLSADLNATQSSTASNFTIDPVSPFTQYTCSLSAINEVGQGPPTQCSFSTPQDGERQHKSLMNSMLWKQILYTCVHTDLDVIKLWKLISIMCLLVQPLMILHNS